MKSKKLLHMLGQIDDRYILEAEPTNTELETELNSNKRSYKSKSSWKIASVAACLILVVAVTMMIDFFKNQGANKEFALVQDTTRHSEQIRSTSGSDRKADFDLARSDGVKVSYVDQLPKLPVIETDLVMLSEEELLAKEWSGYEIAAFKGTVREVRNIVCDYNGSKDYRAIATVEVDEVFRGDLQQATAVTILLPAPVGTDVYTEETNLTSRLAVGMTGIFMPIKYNETSVRIQNGRHLALLDLAEYGLPDGERWLFLETADGLIFGRSDYPSFREVKDLNDVKDILLTKIK